MLHMLIAQVTVLLVVAFFILFAASRTEGGLAVFGNVLGIWVVIVAVLHVAGYFAPGFMGAKGFGPEAMRGSWMHHCDRFGAPMPPGPPPPSAPKNP